MPHMASAQLSTVMNDFEFDMSYSIIKRVPCYLVGMQIILKPPYVVLLIADGAEDTLYAPTQCKKTRIF